MLDINEMSDREILELLLSNQISLAQYMQRIRALIANKFPDEYSTNYSRKLDAFTAMLDNFEDFLREFASSKSKE